jgi:L-amino acid N-acyltransferase YncA
MQIRPATSDDYSTIWSIIEPVIRAGDTYTLNTEMSAADALAYWCGPDKETFVAEEDGVIVGTYYIRANQAGGGKHVCNCGYITRTEVSGKGFARQMCSHSIEHAKHRGYKAMQFNFVVSTNSRAINLWKSFGFIVVGCLPRAFEHPELGYVDAFVMYKNLA